MFSGSRTLCCSSRNTAGQTHAQSNDVSHKKEGTNSFFFVTLFFDCSFKDLAGGPAAVTRLWERYQNSGKKVEEYALKVLESLGG